MYTISVRQTLVITKMLVCTAFQLDSILNSSIFPKVNCGGAAVFCAAGRRVSSSVFITVIQVVTVYRAKLRLLGLSEERANRIISPFLVALASIVEHKNRVKGNLPSVADTPH